jgi:hypothetical protein
MIKRIGGLAAAALLAFGMATPAPAHGVHDWIRQRHPACCGEEDCFLVPRNAVRITAAGYVVSSPFGTFTFAAALQSEDSEFHLCFNLETKEPRPGCFFAPLIGAGMKASEGAGG